MSFPTKTRTPAIWLTTDASTPLWNIDAFKPNISVESTKERDVAKRLGPVAMPTGRACGGKSAELCGQRNPTITVTKNGLNLSAQIEKCDLPT